MHQKLQSGQTTGNGNVKQFGATAPRELTIYITGNGSVSAGAVQLEEAHDPAYAGTWSAIGTPVTVAASTTKAVHTTGAFGAIRARISTTIVGGTVDVDLFTTEDFMP